MKTGIKKTDFFFVMVLISVMTAIFIPHILQPAYAGEEDVNYGSGWLNGFQGPENWEGFGNEKFAIFRYWPADVITLSVMAEYSYRASGSMHLQSLWIPAYYMRE